EGARLPEAGHRPLAEEVDDRLAQAQNGHATKIRKRTVRRQAAGRVCGRMRAMLSSRWAPAAIAAAVTTAFAIWNPPLRDLAAHTFRAEYFEDHGFAIWNGTWYGGHYLLAYSVLFPPLAALLSPVWVGAASAVASAHLFAGLVRARWGEAA